MVTNMFCIDGRKIGVFKERAWVFLCWFLESHMADGWKWRFSLEILCNFMDKMLEGELPDEELCQFLVVVDFM
jgi:hypothetical protein